MSWCQVTLTRLATLLHEGGMHSLVVLDVAGLASVNRRFGRSIGNDLLADAGHRLALSLPHALSERWLGDQFLVLLPDTSAAAAYEDVVPVLGPHHLPRASCSYWFCGGGATSPRIGVTNLAMVRAAAGGLAAARRRGPGSLVWAEA